MITLTEGALTFSFPVTWAVSKYDGTEFYRRPITRTGADLAAVDFAVVPSGPDRELLLIEVKDFRDHEVANRYRLRSGELAVEIARKALHTLAALAVAPLTNPVELRPLLAAVAPVPDAIRVVLLMEEDALPVVSRTGQLSTANKIVLDSRLKLRDALADDLMRKLKPLGIKTAVYDAATVPVRAGWSVR